MEKVLQIEDLRVSYNSGEGMVQAVRGASLSVNQGEVLALVGESGCGKSVTARSILRLNEGIGVHTSAKKLILAQKDILTISEKDMLEIRGGVASMVFQDPLTYLNPTMKVGKQATEALLRHRKKTKSQCREEAVRLLEMVQIPQARIRAEQYPHQFSGGMRQRVMIAMALACSPMLLIADEPTTALDPTIQLQILMLLNKIQRESNTAILIITHDLSVVANIAHNVAIMYAGKIVEQAKVEKIFACPAHPYTRGLLQSLPSKGKDKELYAIKGSPPDLYSPPIGCAFAARCEDCMRICCEQQPPDFEIEKEHKAACWKYYKG